MQIYLNGDKMDLTSQNISAEELVKQLGYDSPFIAVAINESFVPKLNLSNYIIKDSDRLEILSPMAGG